MKKALAVVLAVMMLATLAFAAVSDPVVVVGGGTGDVPQLILEDTAENYALKVPPMYFNNAADATSVTVDAKHFRVEGLPGKFVDKMYVIPLENKDVALDGKADLELGAFKIHYIEDGKKGCYASFKVDGNNLILESIHKNGTKLSSHPTAGWDADKVLHTAYDIGYKTKNLTDGSTLANVTDELTPGSWFVNKSSKELSFELYPGVTLKVPAKAVFKLTRTKIAAGDKYVGAPRTHVPFAFKTKGDAVTLSYKFQSLNGINSFVYAVDTTGTKLYESGAKFTVEKDSAGNEKGYWILNVPSYNYGLVEYNKAQTAAALPGTPADPKNPATGANDVVGVAAALAVVALVSGAAISLKK